MKLIGKKVFGAISILTLSLSISNCDQGSGDSSLAALALLGGGACQSGSISSNTTWSGSVSLCGIVTVQSGATLTVNAGTTVKGFPGSYILVLQGARIVADGTAVSPIVFTSGFDVGSRAPGDWGGIVIIGSASGAAAGETEGVNPQPYGLTTAAATETDNSGTLNYVRIEYAGNEVASGDELNGLSMYGVGSGTTVSYVQIHRGLDDGIEAWGGSVNMDHILVTGTMDDDLDLDEAYGGTVTEFISHKYPVTCGGVYSSDPRGFEMDGFANGGAAPVAGYRTDSFSATITNFTVVGIPDAVTGSQAARFREGFQGNLSSGVFVQRSSGNGQVSANAGGGPATTVGFTNVFATTAFSTVSADADATITTTGEDSSCEFATAPDYTLVNASVNGGHGSDGKWYDGWTTYRAN